MGTVFVARFVNPIAPTLTYISFASNNPSGTSFGLMAIPVPGPCTFDAIYVNNLPTSAAPAADTITYTLYKNGAATAATVSVTSSTTQNTLTSGNATGFSVPVVAGDSIALGITQSNAAPVVQNLVSTRCQ
jgi:hypothetical protein